MADRKTQFPFYGRATQATPGEPMPSLNSVNAHLSRLYQAVAKLGGYTGEVRIPNDLALLGKLSIKDAQDTPALSSSDEFAVYRSNATLFSSSGGSAWTPFVPNEAVSLFISTTQSLGNNVFTDIEFDTEEFDTGTALGGMFVVDKPTRITITNSGRYLMGSVLLAEANATGSRFARIQRFLQDGTLVKEVTEGPFPGVASFTARPGLTMALELKQGDYLVTGLFQDSGGTLNTVSTGLQSSRFWAVRLN